MDTTADNPLQPPALELFQTVLDNGLRVTIHQDPSTVLASVNLWYGVGSRDDPEGRTGFAHLFEHMMFQGSAHVKPNEHFAFLEKVGASLNATTSIDRTNYFETVPVEHLELALWLEADRMGSLDVSQENLDNQIEVVKEEKRQRYDNQPAGTMFIDILESLFPKGHPFNHSTIGSMDDLDAASLDDVRGFHSTFYGPNNAVLTVVSPLSHQDVLARVERYFAGIASIPTPPATPDSSVAGWRLEEPVRRQIDDRVQTPMIATAWRIPPYGHPDHDVAQLALSVLGDGRGSRLARALTRDRELVTPSSGYVQGLGLDGGSSLAVGQLQCRDGVAPDDVLDAFEAELRRLVDEPPTDAELQRARALNAAGWMRQVGGVATRADALSRIRTKRGDAAAINTELDGLLAATSDDVSRVAEACLQLDGGVALTYLPSEAA